jgi:hypothetical protein
MTCCGSSLEPLLDPPQPATSAAVKSAMTRIRMRAGVVLKLKLS